MEVILLFVVGFIVFLIAIISVIKIATNKITVPTNDLNEEITTLKIRVDELENERINS